jgi:hypothetical protein
LVTLVTFGYHPPAPDGPAGFFSPPVSAGL